MHMYTYIHTSISIYIIIFSLMNTSKQLNYNSMRYASLLLELRSGRLGKIEVETTKDLIKIFERYNAMHIYIFVYNPIYCEFSVNFK